MLRLFLPWRVPTRLQESFVPLIALVEIGAPRPVVGFVPRVGWIERIADQTLVQEAVLVNTFIEGPLVSVQVL